MRVLTDSTALFRCILSLLLFSTLHGDHWKARSIIMESGPIATVFGVNVLTGELVLRENLATLRQPHLYSFSLFFAPQRGWQLEEGGSLIDRGGKDRISCSYHEAGRGDLHFTGKFGEKVQFLPTPQNSLGVTNLGLGYLSGQTNHYNRFYSSTDEKGGRDGVIYCGDGSKKSFIRREGKECSDKCDLYEEVLPSGIKKKHRYTPEECRKFTGIEFYGADSLITTVHFLKVGDALSLKLPYEKRPQTNCIPYKKAEDKGIKRIFDTISRTESYPLHFEYWMEEIGPKPDRIFDIIPARFPEKPRQYRFFITKRQEGASSALYAHYYDGLKVPKEEKHPKERKSKYQEQHGKVRFLEQTLDHRRAMLATFIYSDKLTEVLYEKGYRECFLIDDRSRIREVQRYLGADPVLRETYYWGDEGHLTGNLLQKDIFRMQENSFRERTFYEYDQAGNVLKETKRANFAGEGEGELVRTFSYSKDGFNLVLSEDDGRSTKRYRYKAGTNLVVASFVEEGSRILQRRFQEFGTFGTPTLKIEDDGASEDPSDLKGVNERRIERLDYYMETPHRGFLKILEERFWDSETQSEQLLKRSEFFYDSCGNPTRTDVYDAEGNFAYTLSTQFNNHRLPTKNRDALGNEIAYQYNDIDQLTSERASLTEKVTHYNFAKLITTQGYRSPIGDSFLTTFDYDSKLNRTASIDPRGNKTTFTFDGFGRETSRTGPAIGEAFPVSYKEYDSDGNVRKEVDPLGNVTTKEYNSFGKVTHIIYADGSQERFTYDLYGNIIKQIFRNERITLYTYDSLNRETGRSSFSPEGDLLSTSSKRYSGFRLIEEINPLGLVTCYRYDGAGRLIEKRDGDHLTFFCYDPLGNLSEKRAFTGENDFIATRYTYDLKGQILVEAIYSSSILQKLEEYRYDAEGRKTATLSHTSAGLAVIETEYDYLGRITRSTDPFGHSTIIEYFDYTSNPLGQKVLLKITTDPTGCQLRELHDADDRVVLSERYSPFHQLLARESYSFDLAGNLIEKVIYSLFEGEITRSLVIEFEYNSMNQLIRMTELPRSEKARSTYTTYTKFGEKSRVIKSDGTEIFYLYNAYGAVSRLFSEDVDYSFTYNPLLQILTATDEILHKTITRIYDLYGNILSEETPHYTVSTAYDSLFRPIQFSYNSQFSMQHRYDGILLQRVLSIEGKNRQEILYSNHDLSGRYHNLGNIEIKRDLLGREIAIEHPHFTQNQIVYSPLGEPLSYSLDGEEQQFTYDYLNQLTGENESRYRYDSLRCRLSKNGSSYTYSSLNELLHDGKRSLFYDACGRCIRDGIWELSYDALDRLCKATSPSETITYTYDAFNRCTSRNDAYFLYQGDDEVGTLKNGKITHLRFLGIGKGAEIGAAVLLYLEGAYAIPLHDIQGSVRALISPSGKLLNSYSYTAFGELSRSEYWFSWPESPWLFASKRLDPSLNLYQFGRRHYDPDRGPWTTPDPKGYSEGPNLYAYVANNPLILFDLYGLEIPSRHYRKPKEPTHWPADCARHHLTRLSQKLYPLTSPDGARLSHISDKYTNHRPDFVGSMNVGILSRLSDSEERVNSLSEAGKDAEGRPMAFTVVHIPSKGAIPDLLHCALEICGINTSASRWVYNQILWAATNYPHAQIIYEAYSRGTLALNNALDRLPIKIRDRMHVVTLGAACFVPEGKVASCINYVTETDLVPLVIGSANKSIRGLITKNEYNIEYIPANGFFDHGYNSYRPYAHNRVKEITESLR